MRPLTALIFVLAILGATGARAEKQLDGGQVHHGFALELNLGTQLIAITGVTNFDAIQGGFFAGYKISRVMFGLGLEIARVASGTSGGGGGDTSKADTAFELVPGIRVAIVRSADKRVEMFGQFDLGLGTSLHDEHPNLAGTSPDVFLLSYKVGPGARFWAHPQFAVGAVAGVEGDFKFTSMTAGGFTSKTSSGLTSIFAAIQLLGVF
jgi:hypothetical protein